MTVTLEDIQQASKNIQGQVENTPLVHSRTLSQLSGAEVYLKFENLQFTASFKERGALNKLLSLDKQQRETGIIAMSAGNHAQAVAYHAQRLDIPAVIVMPRFTPNVKVEHTRAFGAEVILHGDSFDDAASFANKTANERDLLMVHPYDDEKIIAGQGTIAIEIFKAKPDLDVLIIPVGGGGLISGNAIAAKALNPKIKIIGVEADRYPAMKSALEDISPDFGTSTIAEGIAVKKPGEHTLPVVKELVDDIILVGEDSIEESVLLLLEVEKTLAEGAGATGLAALMKYKDEFANHKVGILISGGNIDMPVLETIIQRGMVRSGRMTRLRIDLRDVPGTLASATQCIEDSGANIIHVHHHRTFTEQPLQMVEVEFILQTKGKDHIQEIINRLQQQKFKVRSIY
ncbi:MAG: threonine ammonia-lyase [Gammaproteobacteria bacterium]|jgi:threonine dehydratase